MTKLAQIIRTGSRPWDRQDGRSRKIERKAKPATKFIFLSFATERALTLRERLYPRRPCQAAGSSCQPSRQLPAIAVTIVSSRHTPSSALLASRRPVQRTNRPFLRSNDTTHAYPPCLPIYGESTPQLDLAGGKDGHHGQERSLGSIRRLPDCQADLHKVLSC